MLRNAMRLIWQAAQGRSSEMLGRHVGKGVSMGNGNPNSESSCGSLVSAASVVLGVSVQIEKVSGAMEEILNTPLQTHVAQSITEPALTLHDLPDSFTLSSDLTRRSPDNANPFIEQSEARRGVGDKLGADEMAPGFLNDNAITLEIAVAMALKAQESEDWELALKRWHEVRQQFPEIGIAWASEIAMLQILGQAETADHLAGEAYKRLPSNVDIVAQRLNVAMARANWKQAETWLQTLENNFSDHPYVRENADRLRFRICDAIRETSESTLLEQAKAAASRSEWDLSLKLWLSIYERSPSTCDYIIGYGQALRECGCFGDADAVLEAGISIYPINAELRAHHAEVAVSRLDWLDGASRWKAVMEEHGELPALWPMAVRAYLSVGWTDQASLLLDRAIERDPDNLELRVRHAQLADRQEEWATAERRWNLAFEMAPNDLNIQNARGDAIWHRTIAQAETSDGGTPPTGTEVSTSSEPDELKALALRFESIGDNCEFGIVQRRMGAEPVGLFRFGAIRAANLIELAKDRFLRLGDAKFLELGLTASGEYLIQDTRGFYLMHTFIRKGSVDEAAFFKLQTQRLAYLKKKLVEDLTAARKVFVYKSSIERIADVTIKAMHAALSKIGPITLLAVRQVDEDHMKGTLEVLAPSIFVGYLETLYDGEDSPVDHASWRAILKEASALQQRSEHCDA